MLAENFDVFLADFSIDAVLIQGTTNTNIKVIFDEEYLGMNLGVEGREITAFGKSSDMTGVDRRYQLAIGSKTYSIMGVHPVGDGAFTELQLKAT